MKKIILGITAAILSAGCTNDATHKQIENTDKPPIIEEKLKNEEKEQSSQSNTQSDNVKTYEDETHNEIEYGKISFEYYCYHIVSCIQNDNNITYECEMNNGETWGDITHVTIKIQETQKQNFSNIDNMISYLKTTYPDYERIGIYNNVTDDSGITNLCSIKKDTMTDYIVSYNDLSYLIESNDNTLDYELFKNSQNENYAEYNGELECGNSFTASVNKSIFYDSNKAKCNITQGKDGTKFTVDINQDNIIIKNEEGKILQTLYSGTSYIDEAINFIDINLDGYADIQLLKEEGALNSYYELYVWNDSVKNFVKVKYNDEYDDEHDDMILLSCFEVHEGYLLVWGKGDANSGSIEKLVWKSNSLIKESEEPYQADE